MITFQEKPFTRITGLNCSNPEGLREKVHQFSNGEIFRYVWNNHGWDIYEKVIGP
jgi:hypothetical protein